MSKESMKSSWFLNALEFFKEDREVKALLRQWSDAIFKWVTLWILQNPREKRNTSSKVSRISHDFSEVLWASQKKVVPSYDVVRHIETVVDRVHDVIWDKWLLTQEWKTHIKETIRLRAFIFWVLDVLRKSWFHVGKKKYKWKLQDVPSKYSMVLYDILKDKALSTLLIVLKSYWFVNLSDNQINDYEVEEEVKVLNINKKEVVSKLEWMGAKKVFEGEVHDVYYDYPDGIEKLESSWGIKSTFRIRTKTDKSGDKYYYTVKRKLTKQEEEDLRSK